MVRRVQADTDSSEFSYAENSPFTKLFETKSRVKILDALARYSYQPLSQKEIEELADVHQSSVSRNKDVLLDIGIMEQVSRNPAKFQLNPDDPRTSELKKLHRQMASDARRLHENDVEDQSDEVARKRDLESRYEEQSDKGGSRNSSLGTAKAIRSGSPLIA